jgi:hypothetical protein
MSFFRSSKASRQAPLVAKGQNRDLCLRQWVVAMDNVRPAVNYTTLPA